MGEKLVVPRRRVRKDWYVGLSPDHADRTQNDVHDDSLYVSVLNTTDHDNTPPVHGNLSFHIYSEVICTVCVETEYWSYRSFF